MITVWEVYRLADDSDSNSANEHVRYYYYGETEQALKHWRSAGGFSAGYGLRLALAKPDWLEQERARFRA